MAEGKVTSSTKKIPDTRITIYKLKKPDQAGKKFTILSAAPGKIGETAMQSSSSRTSKDLEESLVTAGKVSNETKMTCPVCGEEVAKKLLFDHWLNKHQNRYCKFCSFSINRDATKFDQQLSNIRQQTTGQPDKNNCQVCQKQFHCSSALWYHSLMSDCRKATKTQTKQQETAGKNTQQEVVKVHVKLIRKKKPNQKKETAEQQTGGFPCLDCGKILSQLCALKRHQQTVHQNARPFQCEHCGMQFKLKQHADIHVAMVHMKEKTFLCSECGKRFGLKHHLEKHIRTVHDKQKSHLCCYCGKMFGRRHHLQKHERRMHTKGVKARK